MAANGRVLMLDPRPIKTNRTPRTILFGIAAALCISVAFYAILALSVPALRQPLVVQLARTLPVPLVMHLAGSAAAIILGTFQLSSRIRARRIAIHRWLGRLLNVIHAHSQSRDSAQVITVAMSRAFDSVAGPLIKTFPASPNRNVGRKAMCLRPLKFGFGLPPDAVLGRPAIDSFVRLCR
jgi:hypothetical protein